MPHMCELAIKCDICQPLTNPSSVIPVYNHTTHSLPCPPHANLQDTQIAGASSQHNETNMTQSLEFDSQAHQWSTQEAITIANTAKRKLAKRNNRHVRHEKFALFQRDEIKLGKHLGSGGFSDVYEVQSFELQHSRGKRRSRLAAEQHNSRLFYEETALDLRTGDPQYAVKFLKPSMAADSSKFCMAAADFALESELLASLSHPNIVRVHGWSKGGLDSYAEDRNREGYFLVMDRVHTTLDKKMAMWKREKPKSRFEELVAHAERTRIASQIASALAYLHENNVIYRDLKPSNIGLDENGDVKLFDFGLARVLPGDSSTDEVYVMSGKIGTLRYMAPECALQEKYNVKADVYAWSLVYYHMMALHKPYAGYSHDHHFALVCRLGDRPQVDCEWSIMVQDLMERAWSPEIAARPAMRDVCCRLYDILDDFELQSTDLLMDDTKPGGVRRNESVLLELPVTFNCTIAKSLARTETYLSSTAPRRYA